MKEIWKTIKKFPRYSVSNFGEVSNLRTGRIKIKTIGKDGYLFVNLYGLDMDVPSPVKIHRLVAQEFLRGRGETVNHKNGIKTDNRICNLEWMSRADNSRHAWRTGLTPILSGEKCGKSVLKEIDVINIRKRYSVGVSQTSLAKEYRVTQANISAIVKKLTWKHI